MRATRKRCMSKVRALPPAINSNTKNRARINAGAVAGVVLKTMNARATSEMPSAAPMLILKGFIIPE